MFNDRLVSAHKKGGGVGGGGGKGHITGTTYFTLKLFGQNMALKPRYQRKLL